MQRFNPTQIVWMLFVLALLAFADWSGRNLELGPDGLKYLFPQAQTTETLRPPQDSDARP